MTLPFTTRRAQRPAPRPQLVEVTNHWKKINGEFRREVRALYPDGDLVTGHLSDDHPALVAFLERAAAVAA